MLNWLLNHTPLLYLTQSLWRDEAFSVFTAEKSISAFIGTLNFEPPLYYILLHLWIKFFGNSEIAVRSLSLLGFSLATCIVILWAEKRFDKHWLSWFMPILFFFNPMLLYYGFEVRAYGWFMFFSTLSLYAYGQKNFKLTALANILAFYTHTYAIFLPLVQVIHYFFTQPSKKHLFTFPQIVKNRYVHTLFFTGIAIAPWFIPLYEEAKKMRPTWYFPVDLQLIRSVLGNMFTSYDGTPGGLWKHTFILSIILFSIFILAYKKNHEKKEVGYLLMVVFLPLVLVIGVSFFKPLFVNRYLIYVTIAEVWLTGYAIAAIRNSYIQKLVAGIFLLFIICINIYAPPYKAKLDIRKLVGEANAIKGPNDVLFVTSPLIFFETQYYSKDRNTVFLYNPDHQPFPWYIGETAFSSSQMAYELPEYPKRAIIIGPDKSITISYRMNSPHIIETSKILPPKN